MIVLCSVNRTTTFLAHCCCVSSGGLRVLDFHKNYTTNFIQNGRRRRKGLRCRATLEQDAPFAIAMGACMLNSLLFPVTSVGRDDEEGGAMDSTDTRLGVMGVISIIPYFNWLSWVFAWLDTGRQRYLVYTIVYLAPYLRTNLSISPEESWLPIASIIFCIIHVQLEASIKNGDLNDVKYFNEVQKLLTGKKDDSVRNTQGSKRKGGKKHMRLPSSHRSGDEFHEWEIPIKSDEKQKDGMSDWESDKRN